MNVCRIWKKKEKRKTKYHMLWKKTSNLSRSMGLLLMHQSIESLGGGGGRDLAGKHGASAKYCLK